MQPEVDPSVAVVPVRQQMGPVDALPRLRIERGFDHIDLHRPEAIRVGKVEKVTEQSVDRDLDRAGGVDLESRSRLIEDHPVDAEQPHGQFALQWLVEIVEDHGAHTAESVVVQADGPWPARARNAK